MSQQASHSSRDIQLTGDVPTELRVRYKLKRRIGKGSYGTVYEAVDLTNNEKVAIKCIERVFNTTVDAKRTLRELSILRQCSHPSIGKIKNVLAPPTPSFRDVWVVQEHGGWDLGRVVKHHESVTGWAAIHIKFIVYQMLCGLLYMQSANLVHRDLKPSNLLLNEACDLKIIDFGLAREITPEGEGDGKDDDELHTMDVDVPESRPSTDAKGAPSALPPAPHRPARQLTKHVVTRWYRAPELILMQNEYSSAIDMWSVGCIFGELLQTVEPGIARPQPLFPGEGCYPLSDRVDRATMDNDEIGEEELEELSNETHQLHRIFQVLGTPTEDEIAQIQSRKFRKYLRLIPRRAPQDLSRRFPSAEKAALDLLSHMLTFDPRKRITVQEALASPYLAEVRDPRKELVASAPMDFAFENLPRLSRRKEEERLRQLLLEETMRYRVQAPSSMAAAAPPVAPPTGISASGSGSAFVPTGAAQRAGAEGSAVHGAREDGEHGHDGRCVVA